MKNTFSPEWKSSKQPRKQRKYRHKAPLHIQSKFMHAHLSTELRKKHGVRAMRVRVGDKVKIMRGSAKGQTGKIERVAVKEQKIYITKIESVKKDGTKRLIPFHPSNLMITDPNLDDKKRLKRMTQTKDQKTGEKEKNGKTTPKTTGSS